MSHPYQPVSYSMELVPHILTQTGVRRVYCAMKWPTLSWGRWIPLCSKSNINSSATRLSMLSVGTWSPFSRTCRRARWISVFVFNLKTQGLHYLHTYVMCTNHGVSSRTSFQVYSSPSLKRHSGKGSQSRKNTSTASATHTWIWCFPPKGTFLNENRIIWQNQCLLEGQHCTFILGTKWKLKEVTPCSLVPCSSGRTWTMIY